MKKIALVVISVFMIINLSLMALATDEMKDHPDVFIDPSSPTKNDSIFKPPRDDYFETKDFVLFDESQVVESTETVRFAVKNISTMALYLLLILLGAYALFEVFASLVS